MNNVGKCFACFFWGGFVSFSKEDFFLFLRRNFSFSEEDFWGGFFLIQRRSSSFSEENCATAKRKSTLYCSLNGRRARTGPQFSSFQPFRLSRDVLRWEFESTLGVLRKLSVPRKQYCERFQTHHLKTNWHILRCNKTLQTK